MASRGTLPRAKGRGLALAVRSGILALALRICAAPWPRQLGGLRRPPGQVPLISAPRMLSARSRSVLAFFLVLGPACGRSEAKREGPPPRAPVSVADVVRKDVPYSVRAVGNVEAISTVEILPQVTGLVTKVHFKEGDFVKRGDLLFSIDTRSYATSLAAAQAQLAKNDALARQAREESDRQARLQAEGIGTQQELSRAQSNAAALEASLQADRAQIRSASLNVQFTTIKSPIDGRTGSLLVYAGNVVQANVGKPLVVIRTLVPIYVRFSVPEQYLPTIRERLQAGGLEVTAQPRGEGAKRARGRLTFVDNSVDASTGTIALKAEFKNQDQTLWPGQFADVNLELGVDKNVTVVPQTAVMPGQESAQIYVVEGDRVRLRRVEVARELGSEVVLKSGVQPGDRVVTAGQIRLRDQSQIQIKAQNPSLAASNAAESNTPPVRGEP